MLANRACACLDTSGVASFCRRQAHAFAKLNKQNNLSDKPTKALPQLHRFAANAFRVWLMIRRVILFFVQLLLRSCAIVSSETGPMYTPSSKHEKVNKRGERATLNMLSVRSIIGTSLFSRQEITRWIRKERSSNEFFLFNRIKS